MDNDMEKAREAAKEIVAKALAWLVIIAFAAVLVIIIAVAVRAVRWGIGW